MQQNYTNHEAPFQTEDYFDEDRLYLEMERSMIDRMRAEGMSERQIDEILHNLFWYGSIHSPDDVPIRGRVAGHNSCELNHRRAAESNAVG